MNSSKDNYDVIVVGKGPCGISTAIYLKRYNFNVLVIGKDNGALSLTSKIENYYGFESIDGNELVEKGIEQARKLGIEILDEEVVSIEDSKVITPKGEYGYKALMLALGKRRETLRANNLKKFEGFGISYCAICDGFFFRNKKIALVGNGEFMKSELNVLRRFSKDILVFSNGLECDLEGVIKEKIVGFYGDDLLKGIETVNAKYDVDGVFIALGSLSSFSLAMHLGLLMDDKQNLIVKDYMTNIKGIFAGGDCIGGLLQVGKAVSDGANAAGYIKKYLENLDAS